MSASILVVGGPTASGKSGLAVRLASEHPGIEVISADSRQIYRGLDIGTAKPSREVLQRIPHHFIDIIDPDERYSAGRFAADARARIEEILRRGGTPIVVGGTAFYVEALFRGLGAPPATEATIRFLTRRMEVEGLDALIVQLHALDPGLGDEFEWENPSRVMRALACSIDSGLPFSSYRGTESPWSLRPETLLLTPERSVLYERINARARSMVDAGLLEEVQTLVRAGFSERDPGLNTVGYVEALACLRGEISEEEMIHSIQQASRRYAKRQMTWYRNREPDAIRFSSSDVASGWAIKTLAGGAPGR